MTKFFEYRLTVSPEDIDDLEHAGNYHYVRWMQQAAIAHSTANGWSPEKYIELGSGWVVRSHEITYLKPALEGDSVVIKTWVADMKPVTSLRKYQVFNAAGDLLAEAQTDWAFVNYDKQRPTRIPPGVAECFTVVEDE